jgi:two-component system NtrC family sensor kinase
MTEMPKSKGGDLSVSFLSKLISCASDGVVATDKSGRIRLFNEAAEALFGYSIKEAQDGLDIRDLYPGDTAYEIMRLARSPECGGKNRLNGYRVSILTKSKALVPVRLNGSIIKEIIDSLNRGKREVPCALRRHHLV